MLERALSRFFRQPVAQVKVFLDLPSFVTVFHGLLGSVIHFAERMFWITNGFTDDFERFCHRLELLSCRSPAVDDA